LGLLLTAAGMGLSSLVREIWQLEHRELRRLADRGRHPRRIGRTRPAARNAGGADALGSRDPAPRGAATDLFGRHNVGIVYGWIYAARMLGAAILAQVAAIIRDQAGNSTLGYLTAGWMAVAAGVVILALRRGRRSGEVLAAA
jgi:hypothetical protein